MTPHIRQIVANPTPADAPSLRLLAWCILKRERGQRVIQSRLTNRPAPPGPVSKPQPGSQVPKPTGPKAKSPVPA